MVKFCSHRFLLPGLKAFIFLMALGYIWYQLFHDKDTNFQWVVFRMEWQVRPLMPMLLIVLLMPLNWGAEAFKWRYMVKPIEKVNQGKAIRAILAGTTITLITPNRTGGFMGRVLFLRPENRAKASWVSILGNISQLLVTLFAGSLALLLLPGSVFPGKTMLVLLAVPASLLAMFCYWRADWWAAKVGGWKRFKKLSGAANVLTTLSFRSLNITLLWSTVRYFIFALQFWLMLNWCGVKAHPFTLWGLLALAYLLVALIPSVLLGSLGIRESVVLFLFKDMGASAEILMAGSLLLWMINLVIPALAGGAMLMLLRIPLKEPLV